ncbi:MAG: alpha/beta hydrolase fold domain-containing protein [Bryobacteraceae bacterium]
MRYIAILFFCAAACAQQTERDLTYLSPRSQAPALKMDLVKPEGKGPFPVVLLIHGGGFDKGAPRDMNPVAERLQRAGIASAMASYRLTPRFQFPGQVHDLKAAVRYLRANASRFSLRTDRICALGEEAGGTLALFLGFTRGIGKFEGRSEYREFSSAVDCVVSINPLSGEIPAFSGGSYAIRNTNPMQWVTPDAAPVLSIAGPAGSPSAQVLTRRLTDLGVDARSVAASGKSLPAETLPFLQKHLTPAPDRWTVLLSDHGPGAELVAMGWPSGKVLWRVPNGTGLDVHALPNGHVLFTNHAAHRVVEIDSKQKEVWSLGSGAGLVTPFSVRRLSNGNTLVGDADGARVTEFTPQGTVAWKWAKPEMVDLWPRMSRPTRTGTTLVTFQKGGAVLEVNREGKTVWEYKIDPSRLPYQAVRLASGNTLIALVDPGEVIEVDKAGKTVRSIGGSNSDLRFSWIAGIDVLPSGGIMIADFTSRRVVEVDAAGKLVHEVRDLPWAVASIAVMPAPQ